MKFKLKHITLILFLPFFAFAQKNDRLITEKGIYVYNNSKDTIQLSKDSILVVGYAIEESFLCPETKILKKITLGNTSEKGIVFARRCTHYKSWHGGTFDIDEKGEFTKYEIWNLNTKELIFESINYFQLGFNRWLIGGKIHEIGSDFYHYDFTIDEKGKIIISNLRRIEDIEPDHKEGIYEYINGKYIKMD